jgi:hypothetical protein
MCARMLRLFGALAPSSEGSHRGMAEGLTSRQMLRRHGKLRVAALNVMHS